MVSLYNRDHPRDTMMFCVGTLISSKYIVSSAQCVYDALKLRFSPAKRISVNTTLSHFKMGYHHSLGLVASHKRKRKNFQAS